MNVNHTPKNTKYLSFQEAREFAISLKLKNIKEWEEYVQSGKKPPKIPSYPDRYYKEQGWIGWKDFLGNVFVSLEEAKQFAKNLNIKSYNEWRKYVVSNNSPDNIPSNPAKVYKNKGWINWGDYLGTGNIAASKRYFLSFREAKQIVRELQLTSREEWKRYCKSEKHSNNIPCHPDEYYQEWTSWKDFLGPQNFHNYGKRFLSFSQAREYVRNLKLKNFAEWKAYCQAGKRPNLIPSSPYKKYKNKGWNGWGDFLGTFTIGNRYIKFRPFLQARKFARKLKLSSYEEWKLYAHSGKKPYNIPFTPHVTYKNQGWQGYRDFLGIKK